MDDADLVVRLEELQEQQRQRKKQRPAATSRSHCAECGEPIPERRQAAIPGVQLCVSCQAWSEKR